MKIAYNPKTATAITTDTAKSDDIIFDLNGKKVWAKGVRIGTDWADVTSKPSSLPANGGNADTVDNLHASDFVRAYTTSNDNIDSDWGQSFKTFDPIPSGTPPEQSANISLVSIGNNFNRRKELAFPYSNDNIYYRRHVDNFTSWVKLLHTGNTKVTNGVGSINGTDITQVSNSDTVDTWYKDNIQWTGYITASAAGLSSYWLKMYDVTVTNQRNNDITLTFLISEGYTSNFSIFQLAFKQQGANNSGAYNFVVSLKELVGNCKDKIVAYYNNSTGNIQLWGNVASQYGTMNYTVIKKTYRTSVDFATLGTLTAQEFTSVQTQPSDGYTKVTMTRVGQVAQAESATSATTATKLQSSKKFWGNDFNGTQDINGTITFPSIGDKATSNKISWNGSTDGADIYYETTAADQGNLVLNVRDDANAYIQLALNGTFKSHFDVANSYWTGRSASADKWATTRIIKIGNASMKVDGSKDVSCTLAEIGVQNTWRTVNVNSTSIGTATLNLSNGNYIGVSNSNGKVTFNLIGSSTTANQAILSNGTANQWKLQTLNIDDWNNAANWVKTVTATDTGKTIDTWNEIVQFLDQIDNSDRLNTLLKSKLSITKLADKSDISTLKDNALYWVDTKSNAAGMTNGPFTNSPFAMLSVTNYNTGTFSYRSRLAFNDLGEIKIAKCHSESQQDWTDTWYNILTSNNSGISGSTITINGDKIGVSKSDHNHDFQYVKKSGDTMTGALSFGSNFTINNLHIINNEANNTNHQLQLGYSGNDKVDWYEYGGIWNFYSSINGTTSLLVKLSAASQFNGTLTINNSAFGSLIINRTNDKDAASITFKGGSTTTSTYGSIGFNASAKDGQLLRWKSDTNYVYTILDTSSTYVNKNTKTITINGVSTTWENTWRTVQVNGTSIGTATLNLKAGNGISLSNSSGAVTITNTGVYVQQHTTNDINYPLVWSNQSNTNSGWGQQLYKSWADLYYNPKNKRLTVGGSIIAGGAITAPGFKHSSVTSNTNQYVLTADGGYTLLNQIANEGVHTFDKDITVTDTWTDIDGFYGGNDAFLVSTGTYIVQVYYKTSSANNMWDGYFSGIMSWYTGKTNSNNADEIVLHRAGHAYGNTIYLRTSESPNTDSKPYTKLQISANTSLSQNTYTFKFKRIC